MKTFTKDDVKPNFCDGRVTVPQNYVSIHEDAFSGCHGVQEVDFQCWPDYNYSVVEHGLFKDCSHLRTVIFRRMPTFCPFSVFKYCSSKKIDLYVPDDNLPEIKKDYNLCRIFNEESYKTELNIHSIRELTK